MLVKVDIEGVRGEFIMATIESDVFPPEQANSKPKVKHEPKTSSAKQNHKEANGRAVGDPGGLTAPTTGHKRKRTSLALVEGQQQEMEVARPNTANGQNGPAEPSLHDHVQLNEHAHAQEPPYDLDFQPNGTLNPLPHDLQDPQQPLFFSTQDGDDDDEDRIATRQALLRQSQAEVDALNPEELAQMMDDDPDITMDGEGAEESYLGPTQPAADEDDEVVQETGNRRSVSRPAQ